MIQLNTLNAEALELLKRTYKTYPFDVSIADWMRKCDNAEAFLFTQLNQDGTVVYAGVVEICEQGLNARFGSGLDNLWDVNEVHSFLKLACQTYNKTKLRLTGRLGWKKKLKGFGFKEVDRYVCKNGRLSFVYEKTFTDQRSK